MIRYDPNKKDFVYFNVLHEGVVAEITKRTKKAKTKNDFELEVKCICQYHYWSRYEYELLFVQYTSNENRHVVKTDAYYQLRMNWDRFIDYLWGELRK